MKYLSFLLCLLCFEPLSAQSPSVRQVVDLMLNDLHMDIKPGSVDNLKSGNWDQAVTGIATTFMATMEVLQEAHRRRINLIITHEPTFYNHLDNPQEFGENDPVVKAKQAFIEEHGLVIFRFHDIPHQVTEDMINTGMVQQLGWEHLHHGNMIFSSPAPTLGKLALYLKKHVNTSTIRVVGNPDMPIQTIGMLPGAYGRHMQVKKFNQPGIDVLIVGEASEWEVVEYARDAQALGWKRALIVMGHADSEEGGMVYVSQWLKRLLPDMMIRFIPAGNPLWSPE